MLKVESGADLATLLSDTHGFEFYLMTTDGGFFGAFNHHDVAMWTERSDVSDA